MQVGLGQNRTYQLSERCDAITIAMTEPQGQNASWLLEVWAQTDVGRMYVGSINTVSTSIPGSHTDRTVGYAICPGARAWNIEVTGPPTGAGAVLQTAELRAAPAAAPPGSGLGIYRPQGRQILTNAGSPDLANNTEFAGPCLFLGWFGSNESGSQCWLQLFDAAGSTAPVIPNGSVPKNGVQVNLPPNATFSFSVQNGIFLANGLSWVQSTTSAALTRGAGLLHVTALIGW